LLDCAKHTPSPLCPHLALIESPDQLLIAFHQH
jgi:hypothetical protein